VWEIWPLAERAPSAGLDNGIVRLEPGMLRVVRVTSWRFAEHGVSFASIHPAFHVKNYRTEARILDEFGPHALQKRTLKSGRKKKERKSGADPRRKSLVVYGGNREEGQRFWPMTSVPWG